MKTYRTGFLLALIGNILLAVVLEGLWLHYRAAKPMANAQTKQANSSAQDSMATSMATPAASTEAPVVPVQISPERLQSIGVKTGWVESKVGENEIRVTGNGAGDEKRLYTREASKARCSKTRSASPEPSRSMNHGFPQCRSGIPATFRKSSRTPPINTSGKGSRSSPSTARTSSPPSVNTWWRSKINSAWPEARLQA